MFKWTYFPRIIIGTWVRDIKHMVDLPKHGLVKKLTDRRWLTKSPFYHNMTGKNCPPEILLYNTVVTEDGSGQK